MFSTVLNQKINQALTICGYQNPTPIQEKAIPLILEGKDVVASSQTGSGKTAAFVLPALHHLSLQKPSKYTKILILTPTRELAKQIMDAARKYGKYLKFNIISLVGGMPYGPQIKDLARGAEIIIATPGRLMDHLDNRRVDLSQVDMLILDEADRMLDMGFIDDVNYIAKLLPAERQTLLFSATVDKSLAKVVQHLLKDPLRIDMSHEKISIPQIKQEFYKTDNAHHKTRLLTQLLNDVYKAIIFTATKLQADRLADQLCDEGYKAAALHGDLRQNVRNRRIEDFRRGKIQFLVATDVAARGIDISDITHVINFDLPRFCEDYVHRIGRTGRAGKEGIAISFVSPSDRKHLQSIERFTKQKLTIKNDSTEKERKTEKRPTEKRPAEKRFTEKRSFTEKKSTGKKYTEKRPESFRSNRKDRKENRENRDSRDSRDSRDTRFSRDNRDNRDKRDNRESRFSRDNRESRDNRDTRFSRDNRDKSNKFNKSSKSPKSSKLEKGKFSKSQSHKPKKSSFSSSQKPAKPLEWKKLGLNKKGAAKKNS